MRFMAQLPKPVHKHQSLPLAAELLLLIRQQASLFDLLSLELEHLLAPRAVNALILQDIQLRAEFPPSLIGLLISSAQLEEATECIKGIELFRGGQQRLLFMLTMDIDEGTPEFFEHAQGA